MDCRFTFRFLSSLLPNGLLEVLVAKGNAIAFEVWSKLKCTNTNQPLTSQKYGLSIVLLIPFIGDIYTNRTMHTAYTESNKPKQQKQDERLVFLYHSHHTLGNITKNLALRLIFLNVFFFAFSDYFLFIFAFALKCIVFWNFSSFHFFSLVTNERKKRNAFFVCLFVKLSFCLFVCFPCSIEICRKKKFYL